MKAPKVSVIMAAYNSQKYIEEAIESILNQTISDFEFLIIDDCSTDSTRKILAKMSKSDKRILIIKNSKNIGLTKSLNKGLKIAKGKYIARMDADDLSERTRFEKEVSFLDKNKDIFLVGTQFSTIDSEGNSKSKVKLPTSPEEINSTLEIRNCLCHASIMFRKNKGIKYREKFRYSQDYDFYLNLISKGYKIANLDEELYKYRHLSDSISFKKIIAQKLYDKNARMQYFERKKSGKDNYSSMDSQKIESTTIETLDDPNIYLAIIESKIKLNNSKEARTLLKSYWKKFGNQNRIKSTALLISSFLGNKNTEQIKGLIRNFKNNSKDIKHQTTKN